ncbi:Tetratricopeptide repeat protein [uncultured Desulfobacterium sp.]|uniref:Tetratricopeptide repeat protein n=1 Tax=uncultured Desulfobacterium sp. TaxID=201089 RepID=A0A445MSP4_9BACT|nr:Tetratricopeptide repeat protein [uncultured Desulfobacterium sp.]
MTEVRPLINRILSLSIFGLVFLLTIVSHAFSEQIVIDSVSQFDFARALMERNEYNRAVTEFERFIHFFPNDGNTPKARLLIGVCYINDRQFEKARDVLFKIINSYAEGPEPSQALLLIGESYYQQGIFDEAQYYFGQVIERDEQAGLKNHAVYRLAWTKMKEGQWREASTIFNRVERESPFYESSSDLSEQCLKGEMLPLKSPRYAGLLAGLVPGMGHAYVGRYRDASVAFVLNGIFIWAAAESFHKDHYALGSIFTVFEVGWYAGNIYSAVNGAYKYNRKVSDDFIKGLRDRFDLGMIVAGSNAMGLALTLRF